MKKFLMFTLLAFVNVSWAKEDNRTFGEQVTELEKKLADARSKQETKNSKSKFGDKDYAQHLQDISFTIVAKGKTSGGEGSGVIKTRKRGNDSINFVWTAAHVVDCLRSTRDVVDSKSGTKKTIVEFDDALIVKSLTEGGRSIGKMEMFAQVIRFNAEEDLALLQVRKKNFITASVDFYLDEKIPDVGTELTHVGSLLGQFGSNSMTRGIMSQHGRLVNNKVFDQTTVAAFPGSSGGGVYLSDGRLVGLVLRGAGETFNLIAPVRRIKDWGKNAKIEWALDDKIALPSEEELKKLPVEDIGVTFSYSARAQDGAGGPNPNPNPGGPVSSITTFGSGPLHLGAEDKNYPTLYKVYPMKLEIMTK